VQAAVQAGKPEPKPIGPAAPSVNQQMEAKLAERENQQKLLEAEALSALKLPPVATKKTEVLTKTPAGEHQERPGRRRQVLLGWMREVSNDPEHQGTGGGDPRHPQRRPFC